MFTQCPECSATFKITAEQLQQANGKVRCGKCNHIYDALSSIDAEQVAEQHPEWLNDPEEERAREIEAEIDELERTGNHKALTQAEPDMAEAKEGDSPEETTVVSEASPEIDTNDSGIDTVTAFSDAVFSIATDAHAEGEETFSFGATAPEEDSFDDEAGIEADQEEHATVVIEEPDIEAHVVTYDAIYTNGDEPSENALTIVDYDEPEEKDAANDSEVIFTIESEESPAEEVSESMLTNEDIEEILGDSSLDESNSFDENEKEGEAGNDDTTVDADDSDDLEFNVPKQQWGKFFAGGYQGPIIDSVGPLDEPDYDAFYTADDEADETSIEPQDNDHAETDVANHEESDTVVSDEADAPAPSAENPDNDSDDDVLDDLEDLLEEESEALKTYNDLNEELTAQDEDTSPESSGETVEELFSTGSTDVDQQQDQTQEEDVLDDEIDEDFDIDATSESLRKAIDTLTMEKAEWRRLLEAADNDTDSVYMVEDENASGEEDASVEETVAEETNADLASDEPDDATTEDSQEPSSEEEDHDDADEYAPESDAEAPAMVASGFNKPTEADLSEPPLWAKNIDESEQPSGTRRWITATILILLVILLGTQVIHYKRETLATDPAYGETIRNVYAALDRPLFPAWDLAAYEIRGSEAISGESNRDVLDIRAQLAVTGDLPMGEPQIKVTLKDRWGNPVNSWIFSPDQYIRGMRPPNGLIQPGSLIPVHLSVVDPGSAAQGFQLEICLRREAGVLQCDGES